MITIDVARDFSKVPAGRGPDDGDFNGAKFRTDFLVPALKKGDQVTVILDGTEGFGSSFLDEAFGGLVKHEGYTVQQLETQLILVADTKRAERYKRKAQSCIATARSSK